MRVTNCARSLACGPLPLLGALLFVYLLAPIVAFVVRLGGGVSVPSGMFSALAASLATASVATAIVLALGTPLAYMLSRGDGAISRVLLALVALPLALPPLFSGILLLYVFGPLTFLGRLFGGGLSDSYVGIVLAQSFVAAPFLVIAARAAFAAVDPALEDVAASLGHGRLARFMRVAVPAALPGIAAGAMLMWLRAFGEFGATLILAYHPYALPVFTYVQFDETGIPATLAPIAAALIAALLVLLAVQLRTPVLRRRRRAGARLRRLEKPDAERSFATRSAGTRPGDSPATLDFALSKRLGSFSLELAHDAQSRRLALLGPSGAGKTLTLRMLAGLLASDGEGRVRLGGERLDPLPPERRGLGYVPQQPALLPRRTVWSQVNFGVDADPALAATWLARLGLAGLEDRYPEELSGGQQRRVALARALACAPTVLLLDEPFTGLDAPVRDRLRRDLRRLQREAGISTLIVTHDPEEAALLADELLVIGDGRLLQAGTRSEVFRSPRSPEVAALLGIANTHDGVVVAHGLIEAGGAQLRAPTAAIEIGSEVVWSVRPERIRLLGVDGGGSSGADARGGEGGRDASGADGTAHEAVLLDDVDLGAVRELTVGLGELELTLRTAGEAPLAIGEHVHVALEAGAISVWEAGSSGKMELEPVGRALGERGEMP
jgi:molybdate transport system permease protein